MEQLPEFLSALDLAAKFALLLLVELLFRASALWFSVYAASHTRALLTAVVQAGFRIVHYALLDLHNVRSLVIRTLRSNALSVE